MEAAQIQTWSLSRQSMLLESSAAVGLGSGVMQWRTKVAAKEMNRGKH